MKQVSTSARAKHDEAPGNESLYPSTLDVTNDLGDLRCSLVARFLRRRMFIRALLR